jgi:hypothetical protein
MIGVSIAKGIYMEVDILFAGLYLKMEIRAVLRRQREAGEDQELIRPGWSRVSPRLGREPMGRRGLHCTEEICQANRVHTAPAGRCREVLRSTPAERPDRVPGVDPDQRF